MTEGTKAHGSRSTSPRQAEPECTAAPRHTILVNRAKVVQDRMFSGVQGQQIIANGLEERINDAR